VEYNCVLTKVDWLADCIALREDGAVLAVFLRRWQSSSQWEASADKNWPRPLFWPRTNRACHQKPNPSRETIPFNVEETLLFLLQEKFMRRILHLSVSFKQNFKHFNVCFVILHGAEAAEYRM
jgi:hypothetical protein